MTQPDGYPDDLFEAEPLTPVPQRTDLTRIAEALEAIVRHISQQPAGAPPVPPRLAPLPPVQTVASTPPCPNHGIEKVKPSTKFPGFYCTAKTGPGPKDYCPWQLRTAA